jgi:hypothetical protein
MIDLGFLQAMVDTKYTVPLPRFVGDFAPESNTNRAQCRQRQAAIGSIVVI